MPCVSQSVCPSVNQPVQEQAKMCVCAARNKPGARLPALNQRGLHRSAPPRATSPTSPSVAPIATMSWLLRFITCLLSPHPRDLVSHACSRVAWQQVHLRHFLVRRRHFLLLRDDRSKSVFEMLAVDATPESFLPSANYFSPRTQYVCGGIPDA